LSDESDSFLNSEGRIEKYVEDLRKGGKETLKDSDKLEEIINHIVYWQDEKTAAYKAAKEFLIVNNIFSYSSDSDLEDPC